MRSRGLRAQIPGRPASVLPRPPCLLCGGQSLPSPSLPTRTSHSRAKAEAALTAAQKAQEEARIARITAKEFSPSFQHRENGESGARRARGGVRQPGVLRGHIPAGPACCHLTSGSRSLMKCPRKGPRHTPPSDTGVRSQPPTLRDESPCLPLPLSVRVNVRALPVRRPPFLPFPQCYSRTSVTNRLFYNHSVQQGSYRPPGNCSSRGEDLGRRCHLILTDLH